MISAVDPDLQIKRGPGHPDRDIRGGGEGGGGLKKKFSSALRASVWSKNTGGPGPPGPSPGSATGFEPPFQSFLLGFVLSYLYDKNPTVICKQLRTSRGSSWKKFKRAC